MSLSVGIVGLPNVGKSTLFNALLKKQQAYVANFPFATIEPNIGMVPVPDDRLDALAEVISAEDKEHRKPPIVPSTVEFLDIAGLVKGAHKGEGLGNKFLAHIREVDAICHVLRGFSDDNVVREGSKSPREDFETIKIELDLADLEHPNALPFSQKPILIALNVDEEDLPGSARLEGKFASDNNLNKDQVIAICAKTESELAGLSEEDQKEYLAALGVAKSGLERLIKKAFSTLGLITFLTAGEKEVRAWTIEKGIDAQNAAGVIHTDFMKKFIKADVVKFEDFVGPPPGGGGWKKCRENGKVKIEGADYIVEDGDVIEFRIGR